MLSFLFKAGAAAAAVGGVLAMAQPSATSAPDLRYAAVGPATSVPFGWVDFCQRYEGECPSDRMSAVDIVMTERARQDIDRVNRWVNGHVAPISDPDHWALIDRWDYPIDGRGDCEDYALLKRKMLIEMGYPRQALLMTVVKDANQEGHAVLTVRTNEGEFTLDNLNDEMRPWETTGYRFVKRQSQEDQNIWVALGEPTEAPLYTAR
ncbi:MAG TPA: transglutaminase-like cysteine peptidase [Roseiarcus sp.]|nr:transglutaminase-like cysteine peptidase [Roseiarcus sp.]